MPADMRAFRCAPARANTRTHTRPHAHARTRMHREARLESVLGGQHDHNDPGRGWEAHDQQSATGLGSPVIPCSPSHHRGPPPPSSTKSTPSASTAREWLPSLDSSTHSGATGESDAFPPLQKGGNARTGRTREEKRREPTEGRRKGKENTKQHNTTQVRNLHPQSFNQRLKKSWSP
jgi:hypothetical protein